MPPNFKPFLQVAVLEKVACEERVSLGAPFICHNFFSKQQNLL